MIDFPYKNKVILTLNNMGHCIPELTEFSKKFVKFSKDSPEPVLDMGAAYGPATIAALKNNAKVTANDIEERHLQYIAETVKEPYKKNLSLCVGRIPGEVTFEPNTFKAIHSSQVLHFLKGYEIEETAKLMFKWLTPEGKVFIIAGTPYVKAIEAYIPIYERRKKDGDLWPCSLEWEDLSAYYSSEFKKNLSRIPKFMNYLDPDILRRVFFQAGFVIEECKFFNRKNIPPYLKLDGRENVGLIARKSC